MKIRTDVQAGAVYDMTFEECDRIRNYWKEQAQKMQAFASSGVMQPGLLFPPAVYNNEPGKQPPVTTPPPTSTPPPATGGQSGCSWVNGVYYPDYSGFCG